MKIAVTHHGDQFNVALSNGDKEPFLTIKGCRIVNGSNGAFVSWPARKQDNGKWWNHVYASDAFAAAVLAEAQKPAPKPERSKGEAWKASAPHDLDDVPF